MFRPIFWANLKPTEKRQQLTVGFVIVMGDSIASTFGYYYRDSQAREQIAPYGVIHNTFYVWYDTKYLMPYKDNYSLFLIVKLDNFPPKDRMTDRAIEKSDPFTIQDGHVFINHPYAGSLKFLRGGPENNLEYTVVLLPNTVDIEAIRSLNDVAKSGGRTLLKRVQGIPWN